MKQLSLLDHLRVWAAVTGLLLIVGYAVTVYLGIKAEMLPMLIAAIGGFELFLFTQDVWLKWRASRG